MLDELRWALSSAVLVGTLVAVGCSDGGDDTADRENPVRSHDERRDGRELTPLEEYWGPPPGFADGDESAVEMRRREHRVEDQIGRCMREQGFDYIPREPLDEAPPGDVTDEGPWSLPPGEFAERYGYGMFTLDESDLPAAGSAPVDPNQAAIDAMSDAERAAYEKALYGTIDESTGDITVEGCVGEAYAAEFGNPATSAGAAPQEPPEEFAGLFAEMDALGARIDEDPRVTEATGAWVECMADAGYAGLTTPDDAPKLVEQRFAELVPGAAGEPPPSSGGEGSGAGAPAQLGPDDQSALRDYEISVAQADFGCQDGDGKYADVRYDVQVELEQQFVDEHREDMDRYWDWLASTGLGD